MGDLIFWLIVAIVKAGLVAATFVIRYGKKELPPAGMQEATEAPETEAIVGEEPTAGERPMETRGPADEAVEPESARPKLNQPKEPRSRFTRLRRRLTSSDSVLVRALGDLLSVDRIDFKTWDDFGAILIASDLGVGPTVELTEALRWELGINGVSDPECARRALRIELLGLVEPGLNRSLNLTAIRGDSAIVTVAGVNGTGKTATVGKLARALVAKDRPVILGMADAFRVVAAKQLAIWEERVGVEAASSAEGNGPASVTSDVVTKDKKEGISAILMDVTGRLHTKIGLIDGLGEVKHVIEKKTLVGEALLVLDAITGQDDMTQIRIFSEVVDITGVVFTKLDGSTRGGIIIQVQQELRIPAKLVGLEEGVDDLAPFDPEGFIVGALGE